MNLKYSYLNKMETCKHNNNDDKDNSKNDTNDNTNDDNDNDNVKSKDDNNSNDSEKKLLEIYKTKKIRRRASQKVYHRAGSDISDNSNSEDSDSDIDTGANGMITREEYLDQTWKKLKSINK
jgi:hypothetical protein